MPMRIALRGRCGDTLFTMSTARAFVETDSPTGRLTLFAGERGLVAIRWETEDPLPTSLAAATRDPAHPILAGAVRQLAEYFDGQRTTFDLPLDPLGTEFQLKVWRALRDIPYGRTASYGQIARAIGAPAASRAVGAANGRNPIPIVVPCHRVIGANGTLTGFGGGLENKAILLALEGAELFAGRA